MAAPEYVPSKPIRPTAKAYTSPPRRHGAWRADRPGELVGDEQPTGVALGVQGPDQGYALKLARHFDDRLVLGGVHRADAVAGSVAVALKRAALFGRAPIIHDVEMGFRLFGFLDELPEDQAEARRDRFSEVSHPHHYFSCLALADLVDDDTLRTARPDAVVPIHFI